MIYSTICSFVFIVQSVHLFEFVYIQYTVYNSTGLNEEAFIKLLLRVILKLGYLSTVYVFTLYKYTQLLRYLYYVHYMNLFCCVFCMKHTE